MKNNNWYLRYHITYSNVFPLRRFLKVEPELDGIILVRNPMRYLLFRNVYTKFSYVDFRVRDARLLQTTVLRVLRSSCVNNTRIMECVG